MLTGNLGPWVLATPSVPCPSPTSRVPCCRRANNPLDVASATCRPQELQAHFPGLAAPYVQALAHLYTQMLAHVARSAQASSGVGVGPPSCRGCRKLLVGHGMAPPLARVCGALHALACPHVAARQAVRQDVPSCLRFRRTVVFSPSQEEFEDICEAHCADGARAQLEAQEQRQRHAAADGEPSTSGWVD